MWSLLYHYRGQQQTTELFSMTEGMFNLPSKQGAGDWDLPVPHSSLLGMGTGRESLWEAWMLKELSPSPADPARPDTSNPPKPRVTTRGWSTGPRAGSTWGSPARLLLQLLGHGQHKVGAGKGALPSPESKQGVHGTTLPARTQGRARGKLLLRMHLKDFL